MAPEMWGNIFYGEQIKKSDIDALLLAEDSDLNGLKIEIFTPVNEDDEDGQDERAQNANENGSEDTAVFFPERDRLLRNTYAHGGDVVHQTFDQTVIGPGVLEIGDLNLRDELEGYLAEDDESIIYTDSAFNPKLKSCLG